MEAGALVSEKGRQARANCTKTGMHTSMEIECGGADWRLCGTGGEPPFYGNCIYGMNNELRGYQAGVTWTD